MVNLYMQGVERCSANGGPLNRKASKLRAKLHIERRTTMQKTIVYKGATIQVSVDGTIVWNGTIRNHFNNADGYPCVSIKTEKGWRQIGVARLVALAFIPNPENLPEVDHINFDRKDFSVENLRWVSRKENVQRSVPNRPDLHGENNPNYGNRKLNEFYKAHPEIAKEKQGRPGKQNGRYIDGRYM